MTKPRAHLASMRFSRMIRAPREAVYRAFLEPEAMASWLPPGTMTGKVHELDARVGGRFRMSLTYATRRERPRGKTTEDTDTFEGRIVDLVPFERIVWAVEFESEAPEFGGEMRIAWTFADRREGSEVTVAFENLPPGVRREDNEEGARSSLEKLAAWVEARAR